MSVQVTTWVWNQRGLLPAARVVLLCLADHARQDGTNVYPSIETIAQLTELSERQVQRYLKRFVDDGILAIIGNEDGGRGRAREYIFARFISEEKGDTGVTHTAQYETEKDDTSDTLSSQTPSQKGDTQGNKRVTPRVKRVTPRVKRVTPMTQKGDMGVTPTVSEPNEPNEPSRGTVSSCAPAKTKRATVYTPEFEALWLEYPRGRGSKQLAFVEWQKIDPDAETCVAMMDALRRFKASRPWRDPQYIPHCERWLKHERWTNPPADEEPWRNERASPRLSNYEISVANITAAGEPDDPFGAGPVYETTGRVRS